MADNMVVTSLIHETSSPIHIKLDGINYRVWSKLLEMHIDGRKKRAHIFGELTVPKENDSSYGEWVAMMLSLSLDLSTPWRMLVCIGGKRVQSSITNS